ncbi:MAG TPA: bifunctional riboflavin kinase/FAD synthetase [Halanaerobiales bacterium]|nr:bifunctional riboflavin kinase/FAD synthetase [Halanaerobiales bacterium]HPZ62577.1 bifunctional riboflavin kinase/FAD synthetase [Halanaerobiales bacterium]HQD03127.1 bifunctional riboflavin kinase/FAD synthetase [Halanaerobiales bacterium]
MEVIKSSNFNNINTGPMVLTIGVFDGLHLGHQAIINKAKEIGKEKQVPVGIYTFNPNPLKVLKPAFAPKAILSPRQKIELLSSYNLDYYLEQKFTMDFASLDYAEFVQDYLLDKFKIVHLVVGEDFTLGSKGEGNLANLKKLADSSGFEITCLENIKIGKERVSSTLIRKLVEQGKLEEVPQYLGRYYRLEGKVVRGKGRGKTLGVPTANIKLDEDYVLPPEGVYSAYVLYDGKEYQGVVNFGNNPTFPGSDFTIEVHIIGFDKEIYCEHLSLDLVQRIRGEMTFKSSDELVEQIKKDILYTENLLC